MAMMNHKYRKTGGLYMLKKILAAVMLILILLAGAAVAEDTPLTEMSLDELLEMKCRIDLEILDRFGMIDGIVIEPGVYIVGEDIPEGNYWFEGVEGRRYARISIYPSSDNMDPNSDHLEITGIGFGDSAITEKSGKVILKNGSAVKITWGPAVIHPYTGLISTTGKQEDTEPAEDPALSESNRDAVVTRAAEFFSYWSRNDLDNMVALCAPSWREQQENAKLSLFALLQNRSPVGDLTLKNDPGEQVGNNLNLVFDVNIDRHNNQPARCYRMTLRMVYEGGAWYVDPVCVGSYEIVNTPEPDETPVPVTPSPAQDSDGDIVLYYNPNGGRLYHVDRNCLSIHPKHLPLAGTFLYSQVNEEEYVALKPCNVCGAPRREGHGPTATPFFTPDPEGMVFDED